MARSLLLQIALWTGFALLIVVAHSTLPSHSVTAVFVRVAGLALLFNTHQVLYNRFFVQRHYMLYGVLLALALTLVGVAIQAYRAWSMPHSAVMWSSAEILREVLIAGIFLGVVLGVYMFIKQLRAQYELQEARALQAGAELKMLRAQINPHFLFNMMHSLYTLIELQSDKAQYVVLTLSDLMRYMYQTANSELVNLREEVESIARLLELQRIRLGSRAEMCMDIHGDPEQWRIPPLLLLTLVENAFKHGVESASASRGALLRIQLEVESDHLRCVVTNTLGRTVQSASEQTVENTAKTGLVNVRRRLELLYPKAHELVVTDDGRYFSVTVRLWNSARRH